MAETQPERQGASGTPTWVKILLAVSLMLNMGIIGMMVGAGLRHQFDMRAAPPPPVRGAMNDLGFGPFIEAFPPERRRELGRKLRERAGSFTTNRAELRREVDDMLAALRAVPYDPQALQQLIDAQRARILERMSLGRDLLLEEIAAMNDAERAQFADRLEKSLTHAQNHAPKAPVRR